jgi:hypothetical protein
MSVPSFGGHQKQQNRFFADKNALPEKGQDVVVFTNVIISDCGNFSRVSF